MELKLCVRVGGVRRRPRPVDACELQCVVHDCLALLIQDGVVLLVLAGAHVRDQPEALVQVAESDWLGHTRHEALHAEAQGTLHGTSTCTHTTLEIELYINPVS